jgi:hypothetical protein
MSSSIVSVAYLNPGHVWQRVTFDDGTETIAPEPCETGWLSEEIGAWISEGGVKTAYVPPPITADDVRTEARRRILSRYPDWKQHNMTMRGVELQDIWRRLGAWTTAEQAEADALRAVADWIKSVRAASNVMEPSPPADYTADVHWPA